MGVGLAKNARPKGRAAGEGLLNLVLHRALANALLAADIDLQSEPEIASTRLMGMSTSQEFDLLGRY
jgi:hypothetical protein